MSDRQPEPMRARRVGVMPPTIAPHVAGRKPYQWRGGVTAARDAELELLRGVLDAQARRPAAAVPGPVTAGPEPAGLPPAPSPAPPALPALPALPPAAGRCRGCGYLRDAPGHETQCGPG